MQNPKALKGVLGCNTLSPKRSVGLQNPEPACKSGTVLADTSHPQKKNNGHQNKKGRQEKHRPYLEQLARIGDAQASRVLPDAGRSCPRTILRGTAPSATGRRRRRTPWWHSLARSERSVCKRLSRLFAEGLWSSVWNLKLRPFARRMQPWTRSGMRSLGAPTSSSRTHARPRVLWPPPRMWSLLMLAPGSLA